ncbi:MAG TPA: 50S ribosomal protein L13 [Euryarchaeota archaeon]|nr:50S ribosomal protein L13 [archaeon BMS3Bbin15]HDL14616.1 50S ribosomal protein L13 [Euryarchaeota archaeon]
MKIFDASGVVLGRLASNVAKDILSNEDVIVVNAEEAIITGNKKNILEKYMHRINRRSLVNPARHGPFFPKRPDRIIKRTVRGMVPYKQEKGRKAYKRLKVYVGIPEEYSDTAKIVLEDSTYKKLSVPKYIKLGELSRLLGARF